MMRGGDMHTPDCEGYVRLDDNKRYMALKSGILCYYNSDNVSIPTTHSSFPLFGWHNVFTMINACTMITSYMLS